MTGLQSTPAEHDAKVLPEAIHKSYGPYVPPTHSTDPEVYHSHEDAQVVALEDERYKNVEITTPIQGGRRRRFGPGCKIIGLIVVLLLIAAVIGGAVGGVLGSRKKSSHSSGQDQSTPSPVPSDTPSSSNSTNTTVLAVEPMRTIVTAQYKSTIFNVWQKANGDFWMHAYYYAKAGSTSGASKWADPAKLDMTSPAINNTPIAATTWQFSDYFEIRIHYQAQAQTTLSALIFQCNANGTSCTTTNTQSIDNTTAVFSGAGFCMLTPSLNVLHQYTVNSDSLLSEAIYTPNNGWLAPQPLNNGANAHPASPIAAGLVNGEIWVFWFDAEKRLQISSTTTKTSAWSQVQTIPAPIPTNLPRSLGLAVSLDPLVVQIFFPDGTKVQQVRFSNSRWTTADSGSSTIPTATIPDGPLGIVGWNNTNIRMYYPSNGSRNISEAQSENGGVWKTGGVVADGYD